MEKSNRYSVSARDPNATFINWMSSFLLLLAYPSTIFVGTDKAALLICEVRPNISFFGKRFSLPLSRNMTEAILNGYP